MSTCTCTQEYSKYLCIHVYNNEYTSSIVVMTLNSEILFIHKSSHVEQEDLI